MSMFSTSPYSPLRYPPSIAQGGLPAHNAQDSQVRYPSLESWGMSVSFFLLLWILSIFSLQAQEKISWDDLYDVSFSEVPNSDFQVPTFGESLKAMEGKEVYMSGYVLPLDMANNQYVLSSYTFASCFFCGQAGPESVLQLKLRTANRNYRTDEWKRFKGIFRLNDSDPEKMYYILEEAEEY